VPLLFLGVALLAVATFFLAFVALSLVGRYRAGTVRRRARGWLTTVNLVSMLLSTAIFLVGAAITTFWVPRALPYAALGLATGAVVGLLGLAATRWEAGGELHYTPNRWLVLALTLLVTARIAWGLWRGWSTWRAAPEDPAWLEALGAAQSLAAGGVVIGYYLAYTAGVRRRLLRHQRAFGTTGRLPRSWG
jgi:hypothetical protein